MNLTFKKCTLEDLNALALISKSTFIQAFEKDNNPEDFKYYIDTAFNKSNIKKELLNSNSEFYFTFLNKQLVGYFKLNKNEAQTEQFDTKTIELERIYVLNTFQGMNIGKQMLLKIIEIAKKIQVSFLWLGVWQLNKGAIRFYEKYGFKKFDTHFYFIGTDKQTDWLMKLDFI